VGCLKLLWVKARAKTIGRVEARKVIIEKLVLTSFKGFKDFTVKCSEFTTLVGLNNSGKTSILQAVQLLHDIFVYAFGNQERPDFSNPQWRSNPSLGIRRISFGDPDAIWLNKKTAETCKISVMLSGDVQVYVEIKGRNQYELDVLKNGSSIKQTLEEPENRKIIEDIFELRPVYVPPVGAVSPAETFVTYPQVKERLDKGMISECWRAHLYWLCNDRVKEYFEKVVGIVKKYLHEAKILAPRLTRDSTPQFEIQFLEGSTTFDISMSGGGLRTILNLATIIEFSNSKCLLFDEPDAHLHSSLQRSIAEMLLDHAKEGGVQLFVATHAPDFIAEIPVENLVWINRSDVEGHPCSNIGKVLIDLGAVSNVDAVRAYGADKIQFVEGSLDSKILKKLIDRSGERNPFDDPKVITARLPAGKGEKKYIKAFPELLRETFRIEAKMACITDNDYDIQEEPSEEKNDKSDVLFLSLECKEIENYLIQPPVIEAAAAIAANERKSDTCSSELKPTTKEIEAELERILLEPTTRDTIKWQLVPRYRDTLDRKLDRATREKKANELFENNWNDKEWRRRNCPGKQVLRALRNWCQDKYSLTLTDKNLVAGLKECPSDIMEIGKKLSSHFYEQ